ncbi:MAG TPA: hypothetical protein VK737_13235, partial [Opitutales bacterium]|nr:hypothetical protein [Opitutales bacterium]
DIIYPGDIQEQALAVNSTMITGTYNATTGVVTYPSGSTAGMLTYLPAIGNMTSNTSSTQSSYSGNLNDLWGGVYDNRRLMTVSTLNVDMGALKAVVDNNSSSYASSSPSFFSGSGSAAYNPANQYNGVVYVEFPSQAGNTSRLNPVSANGTSYPGDAIIDSVDQMGLGIINADSNSTSTGVPNPNYTTSSIGQAGRVNGFTLGTNNCVYLYGNYNADGNLNTPESDTSGNMAYNETMPDNAASPDPSCLIAADSVTFLSGSWLNRSSKTAEPNVSSTGSVEVDTAVIQGIVPSEDSSANQLSGGVINYPRFLENWTTNNTTVRYRGSMVCLFKSEVASQAWQSAGIFYSAPTREWGYYNQFKNGIYPPGTPSSRTYFRVNFSYITQAQYNTATAGL